MPAPFFVLTTYLAAIPLVFGLVAGVWSCLIVIAGNYGLNLASMVPWFHVEQSTGMPAPIVMLIISALAFAWSLKMGPGWIWHRIGAGGVLLGIFTIPYWLELPLPELWAVATCALIWFGWRRFISSTDD